MSYNRTIWENNKTPLNANNMNNIEEGIAEAKEDAASAIASANNALSKANQAVQQVQHMSNQANNSIADLASKIADLEKLVNAIEFNGEIIVEDVGGWLRECSN